MNERCETCRFFRPVDGYGHCHRFPPVADEASSNDHFPTVQRDQWCGEWKKVKQQ